MGAPLEAVDPVVSACIGSSTCLEPSSALSVCLLLWSCGWQPHDGRPAANVLKWRTIGPRVRGSSPCGGTRTHLPGVSTTLVRSAGCRCMAFQLTHARLRASYRTVPWRRALQACSVCCCVDGVFNKAPCGPGAAV